MALYNLNTEIDEVMIVKHGSLFVCTGTSFSYGDWIFSNVTLLENNALKIEVCISPEAKKSSVFHLSPEWFIITPRPTTESNCPPLPENKKRDGLFAITQPSETSIWFLAGSKYERNQWIEKILPIITLKPPTPPEPPPPYSEYDNLSYIPWDHHQSTATSFQARDQSSFYFRRPTLNRSGFYSLEKPVEKEPKSLETSLGPPRPTLNRSGFYSLERPIKKEPEPVEPSVEPLESAPPAEPLSRPEPLRDSLQCVNCVSLSCAFVCNTLSVCLQMCCNNISTAL